MWSRQKQECQQNFVWTDHKVIKLCPQWRGKLPRRCPMVQWAILNLSLRNLGGRDNMITFLFSRSNKIVHFNHNWFNTRYLLWLWQAAIQRLENWRLRVASGEWGQDGHPGALTGWLWITFQHNITQPATRVSVLILTSHYHLGCGGTVRWSWRTHYITFDFWTSLANFLR